MTKAWSSADFASLSTRLDAAISWLRGFGVRPETTRLAHYRRSVDELAAAWTRADPDQMKQVSPGVVNDLFEANEYATIHDAFADGRHDHFVRARIEGLRSGPRRYVDETSAAANLARNLMFELTVGARLVASGLTLSPHSTADVGSTIAGMRLEIECKRPQSDKQVERHSRKARDQLVAASGTGGAASSLGLIAIDLTKLTNPDFQLLVRMPADEGTESLAQHLKTYFHEREAFWSSLASDQVVGLLFRLAVMAHFSDERSLTYCQQWTLVQLHTAGEAAQRALRALNLALAGGVRRDAIA